MTHIRTVQRLTEASLRGRLVALVLIPVLGMSVFTVFAVVNQLKSVRNAEQGRALIEEAAAIDRVRVRLMQEIVPRQAVTVLSDPAVSKAMGVDGVSMPLGFLRANVATLEKQTDEALAEALRMPGLRDDLAQTREDIPKVRTALGVGTVEAAAVKASNQAAYDLVDSLGRLETAKVVSATQLGLDGPTSATLRELDLVMQATKSASRHFGQYMPIIQATDETRFAAAQRTLRDEWAVYRSGSQAIEESTSPELRQAWQTTVEYPVVDSFNKVITTALASGSRGESAATGLQQASVLLTQDVPRNKAFSAVLQYASDRATTNARAMEARAWQSLWVIVALSLGLDWIVFMVVFYINRSITRPLSLVAMQAEKLSLGELSQFPVSGPREVRTVARGLDAAVDSLQRIQDAARAVADGDLESSALSQPLPGRLGEVIHASMGRIVDAINAQEVAQKELAHRAAHDALTELPNRAQALERIEQALNRGTRHGSSTALLFVDLDKFKQVNDTLGHQAGDKVLQIAAQRMRDTVRDGDTVARLGGDEFVIILENVDNDANFIRLAERLVANLSAPMEVMGHTAAIGASIGIALSSDGATDASAFLKEADAAVYEAKRGGRGRVDVFDDHLRRTLADRADLETAMMDALRNDEFELHYQPVVDLHTGRTRSVEALIRWNRPGVGMVPPDQFIPTAEMTNLINDIGRWTLSHATRQLKVWTQSADLADLTVAVNISGRHLSSQELLSDVRAAIAESGIEPHQLILEITETFVLDDARALYNMSQARELGVRFALDDFGTGFTSIGQLARLPIDILKIDRSFTASEDPTHRALVELMVTAAHTFGLQVVAEGIETARQVQDLRRVLADTGQGYFFARPAPAAQVLPTTPAG